MKFILIFGPNAVGKMTVGQELEKMTGLKLFHNHMTIELVSPFFSYSSDSGKRIVRHFRQEIFEEVAKSNLDGLIFTYIWAFNEQDDWDYVENVCNIFRSKGGEIYFAELEADLDERLARNRSPHRLNHKPTKRNLEWSEKDLKEASKKHRLNSEIGEIKVQSYIRINNTKLSPEEVAKIIKEKFQL
jgi:hypothetical protein